MAKFKFPLRIPKDLDWIMIITVLLLIMLGIGVIYSTTYGDQQGVKLAWYQGIFAGIGIVVAGLLTLVDYRAIKSYYLILYVVGLLLLILVLILGKTVYGASRWIDFGVFQLQPSEIFKLLLILFLGKIFSETKEFNLKKIVQLIVLVLIPAVLILAEPDLGTALVLVVIFMGMIIAAGIKKIYLFAMGLVALVVSPIAWLILKDYQKQRLLTFLNPASDPFGSGYNVLQSIIAVGSGELSGRGLGHGSQSQLNFLPIKHSDFIFAVFAEELGFVGAIILLLLFSLLIIRIIRAAKLAGDDFGMLVAVGISIMFIFQILVNVGMNIGIMPVTGIPLPFVSYGGTSLIVNLAAIGILLSILVRHRKLVF